MISSNTDLETEVTLETSSQVLPADPAFRILMLGNWSGKDDSGKPRIVESRPMVIDRDNYSDVLKQLEVCVALEFGNDGSEAIRLQFEDLDDFHPDKIFDQVPMFSELRGLRRRLLNESSFSDAASEVRALFEGQSDLSESKPADAESGVDVKNSEGLLDDILNKPLRVESGRKPQITQSKELTTFLGKIVRSHIVETDENEQARLLKYIDDMSSELMRLIIHHPKFKELEASWRGVYLLVRKIETDVDLKIYLVDVNKAELSDDLKKVSSLRESQLYKWVVRDTIETPGAESWAVVCGNFTFDVVVDDIATLIRIAKISEAANAPFISHISDRSLNRDDLSSAKDRAGFAFSDGSSAGKLWATLRSTPESEYLGAAMPRFLARLPYGAETDPIENFSFEEFKETSEHENYLWSNPAFFCGLLLAQTYRMYGWDMTHGFQLSFSGLPTHIFEEDGETKTKPCAEFLMTEALCQELLDRGVMPLISFKNSDRVQLGRFQSVASPAKALSGHWR